jgi:hypothetical protein
MIKKVSLSNNKKGLIAGTAAVAITILLVVVVSIAAIGAAPFSYQQASESTGPRITSANIVNAE